MCCVSIRISFILIFYIFIISYIDLTLILLYFYSYNLFILFKKVWGIFNRLNTVYINRSHIPCNLNVVNKFDLMSAIDN